MSYYADLGFEAITPETLRERTASPAVQRFLVEGVGPVSVSGIPELGRILLAMAPGQATYPSLCGNLPRCWPVRGYKCGRSISPICSR